MKTGQLHRGRQVGVAGRAFWDTPVFAYCQITRVQRCFARWRYRAPGRVTAAVIEPNGARRWPRLATGEVLERLHFSPDGDAILDANSPRGLALKRFAVRAEAQRTTACCIAHKAAAARVDTPILV